MRRVLIAIALIATPLLALAQTPAPAAKPKLKVNVRYDKEKDVTKLELEPLSIWNGASGKGLADGMMMSVSFVFPQHTIVKPEQVWFLFVAGSDQSSEPFKTEKIAALVDGVRIDLGTFKAGRGNVIRTAADKGQEYEGRAHSVSYENFAKLASAKKLTLLISDLKCEISEEHLQALRDFHNLMQREGLKVN